MKIIKVNSRVKVLNVKEGVAYTQQHIQEAIYQGLDLFITWGKYIGKVVKEQLTLEYNPIIILPMLQRMQEYMKKHPFPNAKFEISDEEYEELNNVINQQPKIIQYRFKAMIDENN